ncbi:MAG: XamI family restriction endonuclease [Parvularculaceae bacterium]
MPVAADIEGFHREQAQVARDLYSAGISNIEAAKVWRATRSDLRSKAANTLSATAWLSDIEGAICASAAHISVLRRLMAPPMSQDQFSLLCAQYSKGRENAGGSVAPEKAKAISKIILDWRDRELTKWLDERRGPTDSEVEMATESLALLMAAQSAVTNQRTLAAATQERAAIELLASKGWTKKSAPLITQSAQLSVREFMHKTRFATKTASQEVDIACGLGGSGVILAMECKVTNDATNSVKRINDILKKAKAWQDHWGNFVRTGALLQGVIAYKDVHRLLDDDVVVFWSHSLADFSDWLDANVAK